MSILGLGFKKTTDKPAALDDTIDITEDLALSAQLEELEDIVADDAETDPQGVAAGRLADYRLTPLSLTLLDKAIVNVAENNGRAITDPQQKDQVLFRGEILANSGHDLSVAIDTIIEAVDTLSAPGLIYNLVFNIQKAVNFVGSVLYRQALDPNQDIDLVQYADYREEDTERAAPYGLGVEHEDINARRYEGQLKCDVVKDAIDELHIYLQLVTEAFGWDPEQPMPYMFLQNKDGSFKSVWDLNLMLDIMEIRRQEARAKRDAERSKNLGAALARSRALLKKAARKPA